MKEIIIIIIIILLVLTFGTIIQKYLEKSSNDLLVKVEQLKSEMNNDNLEKSKKMSDEVQRMWEETDKKWSMVITHEELDKIKLSLLKVKACIDIDKLEDGLKEIDNSAYLIGHIKEKEAVKLRNIF